MWDEFKDCSAFNSRIIPLTAFWFNIPKPKNTDVIVKKEYHVSNRMNILFVDVLMSRLKVAEILEADKQIL